jgi:hypothetical protein
MKTTLETSGEDNENPLETSGEDNKNTLKTGVNTLLSTSTFHLDFTLAKFHSHGTSSVGAAIGGGAAQTHGGAVRGQNTHQVENIGN